MRKAFSLIELLIVIAVIGILAGMMVPRIGRVIKSAEEATCRANMKNLHTAALNYAISGGRLPLAGSNIKTNLITGDMSRRIGWVSWYSTIEDDMRNRNNIPLSEPPFKGNVTQRNSNNNLTRGNMALTTIRFGSLYDRAGDVKSYRCPTAAREIESRGGGSGRCYLTYFMNGRMGFSEDKHDGVDYPPNPADWNASTTIIFAERPMNASVTAFDGDNCVLKPGSGSNGGADGKGATAERFGVWHRASSGGDAGMVVFLDGHVDKLPVDVNGKNVAWWLVRGDDSILNDASEKQF